MRQSQLRGQGSPILGLSSFCWTKFFEKEHCSRDCASLEMDDSSKEDWNYSQSAISQIARSKV